MQQNNRQLSGRVRYALPGSITAEGKHPMSTPIRRKLPPQITAFAATPLAWHRTADICAWRDAAYGDEFLAIDGIALTLPEGAAGPIQLVINAGNLPDDKLPAWGRYLKRVSK
jgi:hypothetical protein